MPETFLITLSERLDSSIDGLGPPALSVRLSGEIDTLAMPALRRALAGAALAPGALSLDVTAVTFLGLSAIGALLVARAAALRGHDDVAVVGAPRVLQRMTDRVDHVGLPGGSAVPRR